MSKKIKHEDFLETLSNKVPMSTPRSCEKYLLGLYQTILEQLELNGSIYIKNFGELILKEREASSRTVNDLNNDGMQLIYIKPKKYVYFKPDKMFEFCINDGEFHYTRNRKKVPKENKKTMNYVDLINIANSRKGDNNNG